jgi:hypothetical protein
MVEMDQDRQIYTTQQKKFKKMLRKTAKSRILIASLHFQWCFYERSMEAIT